MSGSDDDWENALNSDSDKEEEKDNKFAGEVEVDVDAEKKEKDKALEVKRKAEESRKKAEEANKAKTKDYEKMYEDKFKGTTPKSQVTMEELRKKHPNASDQFLHD